MPKFPNDPVICINDSTSTPAVLGEGKGNEGVRGVSHNEHGAVVGINDYAPASPPGAGGNGGWFESAQGEGVRGWSKTPHHGGVVGVNTAGGFGVYGQSDGSGGVVGESKMWIGVYGASESTNGAPGVMGEHKSNGVGVKAVSKEGAGLAAYSTNNEAIHAETHSPGTAAIAAYNLNTQGTGAAIFAKKEGAGHAGFFDGEVYVSRSVTVRGDVLLQGADCAEEFVVSKDTEIEPGTVMVVGAQGMLEPSSRAYDKRVAGVVSGAGEFRPGIILDRKATDEKRVPIALLGKVYCKVDSKFGAIEVGDLLTTSAERGVAMKVVDPLKGFGTVIGKALMPLSQGQGLIPILIALQ